MAMSDVAQNITIQGLAIGFLAALSPKLLSLAQAGVDRVRLANRERRERVDLIEALNKRIDEDRDQYRADRDDFRVQLQSARTESAAVKDLATSATTEARAATAEAAQLKSQVERLSSNLEAANALNAENANMLQVLRTQQATDMDEIAKLRATNADQEKRLRAVEAERDGLRNDKTANLATIDALQQRLTALSDELTETKRQLDVVAKRTPTAPLESIDITPPTDTPHEPPITLSKET